MKGEGSDEDEGYSYFVGDGLGHSSKGAEKGIFRV